MTRRASIFFCAFCGLALLSLRAEEPQLLAKALQRWSVGHQDLAFTQQTREFLSNGEVKEERLERFDPSLPDSRRWTLLEVNGRAATDEQRRKWETRKNGRPRRKVDQSPSQFLDLDHAVLISGTAAEARYRIPVLPKVQHLVSLEQLDIVVTIDRRTGTIAGVGAVLREPVRLLLGLAHITDLDVDIHMNPVDEADPYAEKDVGSGSTARVKISRLGRPVEYNWRDFKRVVPFEKS
jgi:hypothetical protein